MKIGHCQIEFTKGDITDQEDLDAIVNAANAELMSGGGVAGAIHNAAGSQLAESARAFAPISPGEAVTTKAFDLPNQYVIHCLGPVYGKNEPADQLLSNCYTNAILEAEKNKIQSLGFPAISTGAFGYPVEEATEVALKAVKSAIQEIKHLTHIRFILFSKKDYDIYQSKAEELL